MKFDPTPLRLVRQAPTCLVGLLLLLLTPFNPVSGQMITAHRGASYDAPENTLAAFQLAWEQGADAVEGDFYLTADSQIVCIHDADTLRTTGVKEVVATTDLDRLRELDAGSWKSPKFSGEKIPTFAEVMESIPAGKRFYIELKTGPEIVPVLATELERLQPDRRLLTIIAFDARTVAACKKRFPDIKVHWLTGFKQADGNGVWNPTAQQIAETVRSSGADGVGLRGDRKVVDREFITRMTELGVPEFHVWTIDSPADARHFRELGAMGITTNRPAFLRESLSGD
ncbi:MAG: glycerophosphodiester phosphodiesterase [Planctomycetaceae bacterium]|nr:MAG: glycerophosphodiester phosphodiesterase [Planctomycetaceae bacterium]